MNDDDQLTRFLEEHPEMDDPAHASVSEFRSAFASWQSWERDWDDE